jgi:hypothetical protein
MLVDLSDEAYWAHSCSQELARPSGFASASAIELLLPYVVLVLADTSLDQVLNYLVLCRCTSATARRAGSGSPASGQARESTFQFTGTNFTRIPSQVSHIPSSTHHLTLIR